MTVPLTGTGGLFTRLGRIIFALNSLNVYMGSTSPAANIKAIGLSISDIEAQYQSTDQSVTTDIRNNLSSARTSMTGWEGNLSSLAQATVISMANDDVPLPSQDLNHAIPLIIGQMTAATASVNQPTTSASAAVPGQASGAANNGNGVVVSGVLAPNGLTQDYIFAETVTLLCSQDSQNGATVRQEQFTITTPVAATDVLGFNFPLGSGLTSTLNVVDATQNQSATGNMLFNSDFETDVTTPNLPDQWVLQSGTLGTDVVYGGSSSGVFGLGSLTILTNAGSTPGITQQFGTSSGTTSTLAPLTQYAVNGWAKKNASTTGGTVAISLVKADGTTIINDQNGVANTITLAAASMNTNTFTAFNGYFRTPAILPANAKIKVYMSVAETGGGGVITIGGVAMTPANPLYTQGPSIIIFAGPNAFYVPDQFTVAINNNYGGKIQKGSDQLLGMRVNGFAWPSSATPTVSDSLVA